ncbi:MAG: class I SAM-dependent methyltransferase [Candidatus Nanopelagicales bacterium]|nr:class I SAM-dependent methyltransferase [Candidatus Nanopelagicales bacterium]MCF8536787.1 class I SAM-dependent methyltransferase [Candidatus Nanopelagicales bacterium]MCF8541772.1 class I SAM-dependent methyltransferase [Candidatus Nanopelagicales bacterium]MCF8556187.1 class I SAM-dependent methyltransferase [Candidatus Nanopelagicales bacterium]
MSVASHYDGSAAEYGEQYKEENLLSLDDYPANYFRLQLMQRRLGEVGSLSVYEIGAGDGTPLATLARQGLRVAGCDLSANMVKQARNTFADAGLDPLAIVHADILDADARRANLEAVGQFDAVMALGVIPHVPDDQAFVAAMSEFLAPGGRLFMEFRNSLFSLFTFNRYTKEFVLDELLRDVSPGIRAVVAADLDRRLAVDKPPIRKGTEETPGYDEILARFHNPFELSDVITGLGFTGVRFHWYHYHPAYPMLASEIGRENFRRGAFALEHEGSWRGMFLCSAGVIEAVKHGD